MLDLSLVQIDDPESFVKKNINLHEVGIEINALNLQILIFISLFDDVIPFLELYVVNSGSEDSQFSDLYHIKKVCNLSLITEINSLKTHKIPEVPQFDLPFVVSRDQHRTISDQRKTCNQVLMADKLSFETGIHVDWMQIIYFYFFLETTHEENLVGLRIKQCMRNSHSLKIDFSYYLSVVIVIKDNSGLRAAVLAFIVRLSKELTASFALLNDNYDVMGRNFAYSVD